MRRDTLHDPFPMMSALFADADAASAAVELIASVGRLSQDFTLLMTEPRHAAPANLAESWFGLGDGDSESAPPVRRLADAIGTLPGTEALAPSGVCVLVGDHLIAIGSGPHGGETAVDLASAFVGSVIRDRDCSAYAAAFERGAVLIGVLLGQAWDELARRTMIAAGAVDLSLPPRAGPGLGRPQSGKGGGG